VYVESFPLFFFPACLSRLIETGQQIESPIFSRNESYFRHFISSLNPDDPSVTWINAGALDFWSRLQRDGRLFDSELRAFTSPTATDLNDIQRSLFKDCVKKTLTMAGRFEHEKRACEALRQLARTLPLLLLTHSKMKIRAACNKFLKGEWESLWNKCMAKGHARQDKLAANPLSASSCTSAQKEAMAQKQARAGNLPKANQTVCSVLKPAFGHDTLHKLQEKTPVGSVVFDKKNWPTTDALDEMRRHDEWLNIQEHSFSIKKIGQYFCTCKPLSAQDADGWRGREHVGWLFSDGNSALQELFRMHLILPNILGDFLAGHFDEIAGGRMFALVKANNSLRPIVIGSLWRRCAAHLGVADVNSNVATFFMSQYTNFIQFGGESDGATRCAQVTQLLAAAWAQHSEENPLVVIQLNIINAYTSADRQAKSYDNGHVHMGDDIPCPSSLRHYWSYFESMPGTTSTLHFSDYQGRVHKIACSKGGQQGDAFETVRFAVTTFPSFGRVFARHGACTGAAICDDVFIVAPLAESLALAAELKQVLKQDLDLYLDVPKFICFFPGDRINGDDHARALFQNALQANPQLACLSGMDAGISTTGLRVAGVPIGNDEWVQQFVQAKAAAVKVDVGNLDIISDGLIHYQMLRFCQNTRLAFLGRNTLTPLISDIFQDVDVTILEALCRKSTTNAHCEWTAVFCRFVDMKLQLPHFRGGFGVTPMLVLPFLRSMRHQCLSCNGSVFAVMLSRISLTLPAHGPQAKI